MQQISIERCRELLGSAGESMSDSDVESLRNQLYGLAAVIVEAFDDLQQQHAELLNGLTELNPPGDEDIVWHFDDDYAN